MAGVRELRFSITGTLKTQPPWACALPTAPAPNWEWTATPGQAFARQRRSSGEPRIARRARHASRWMQRRGCASTSTPRSACHRCMPMSQAVVAARDAFKRGLDRLVADYPADRVAQIAPPPEHLMWDNFYLAYQGCNDRDLQQRFGDLVLRCPCRRTAFCNRAAADTRSLSDRNIALVSGRFHRVHGRHVLTPHGSNISRRTTGKSLWCMWARYRDAWTEHLARSVHAELTLDWSVRGSGAASARTRMRISCFIRSWAWTAPCSRWRHCAWAPCRCARGVTRARPDCQPSTRSCPARTWSQPTLHGHYTRASAAASRLGNALSAAAGSGCASPHRTSTCRRIAVFT